MSVVLPGVPQDVVAVIQDRTLERVFHDALFPRLLYRLEASPELWPANLGEQMVFTRTGLIEPKLTPVVPGQDPVPSTYATEQWSAVASQFTDTIDTHMPSSNVAIASLFLRNTQQLGLNSGQVLNRLARNKLFVSYLGGETNTTEAYGTGVTQIKVASLNGFTENVSNGTLAAVSPSNPLPVLLGAAGEPANVVGAIPVNAADPFGPGTLVLSGGTSGALTLRDVILAVNRSRRLRVGGAQSIDGLGGTNILTLNDVISAVSRLREQNVPPHADGYYHVHLSPQAEAELFRDNHWQRLHQSLPDSYAYRALAVGQAVGCIFFRNTEDPNSNTTGTKIALPGSTGNAIVAPEIGGQIANDSGLPVVRTLVTGGGALVEKYLDESKYITDAGVTGKIGQFSIVNGGAQVMTQRIRMIIRAPLDRLQQVVSQTWSWSGDFPVPSDLTAGDSARYKRAVVIEHA